MFLFNFCYIFDTLASLESFENRCPRGFFEEIDTVCIEKTLQIQTGTDKNPKKNSDFQKVHAIIVYFSKDLVV